MKSLAFKNYKEFASSVRETYDFIRKNDGYDVAIVAKYNEAKEVIKELLYAGYNINSIDLSNEMASEYWDEYIISLLDDEIWCEPMLRETGYIGDESDVIYVLGNCSSKVLKYLDSFKIYEVCIGDECKEPECSYQHCQAEEVAAPSPKNTYMVNDKIVTKKEFDEKFLEIEKMLDNLEEIFQNYSKIVDKMNEYRLKLF